MFAPQEGGRMRTSTNILARRLPLIIAGVFVVAATGCGGGRNGAVARICIDAMKAEVGERSLEGDAGLFADSVREEGEGIVVIESTVVVDKGLTSEATRGFMCRVQTDPQGKAAPSLILLQMGF
jgi:hypothetical protein